MSGPWAYTNDPHYWQPGLTIKSINGDIRILKERKPDNSGWWLTDGFGLHDDMVVGGVWIVVRS